MEEKKQTEKWQTKWKKAHSNSFFNIACEFRVMGNLKNEIATIERTTTLQIVKKSLMKKQTTSTLYKLR